MIELFIVAAGMAALMFATVQIYTWSIVGMVQGQHKAVGAGVVRQIKLLAQRATGNITVPRFDPTKTLVLAAGSTAIPVVAGGTWNLNAVAGGPFAAADVPTFSVDAFTGTQTSFELEVVSIDEGVKDTSAVIISRCVNRETFTDNSLSLDDVLTTLPVTYLIDGKLACCTFGDASCLSNGGPLVDKEKWYPSIFHFNKTGTLTVVPNQEERRVMTGAGFMMTMSGNPPGNATLHIITNENRCLIISAGFGGRSPNKCADGDLGKTDYEFFDTDFRFSVNVSNLPFANDIRSSSFIKIGIK